MLQDTTKTLAVVAFGIILLSLTTMPVKADSQTSTPHFIAVSAGSLNTLVLGDDGTVWACGTDGYGESGVAISSTNIYIPSWTKVQGISDAKKISAGGWAYSMALKNDGTVWTWGTDTMLGRGLTDDKGTNVPGQLPCLQNVVDISAGNGIAFVVKDDGTVWGWSAGINTDDLRYIYNKSCTDAKSTTSPHQIDGLSNIKKVIATTENPCAVGNDGTAWTWGMAPTPNGFVTIPPKQLQGISNVIDVAGGQMGNDDYLYALKSDGTVWQLENPIICARDSIYHWTQVNGPTDIKSLSDEMTHMMALSNTGDVWTWGMNDEGEIGNGHTDPFTKTIPPYKVPLSGIMSIAAGSGYSMAVAANGSAWGWGRSMAGNLGNGRCNDPAKNPNDEMIISSPIESVAGTDEITPTPQANPMSNGTTINAPTATATATGSSTETPSHSPGFDFVEILGFVGAAATISGLAGLRGRRGKKF